MKLSLYRIVLLGAVTTAHLFFAVVDSAASSIRGRDTADVVPFDLEEQEQERKQARSLHGMCDWTKYMDQCTTSQDCVDQYGASSSSCSGALNNVCMCLVHGDEEPCGCHFDWIEDFAFLSDGATSDTGITPWTATRGGGLFQVQNEKFVVNDKGPEGVLETGSIDVSLLSTMQVSVDVYSEAFGDSLESADYVELYTVLDGGPQVLAARIADDVPNVVTLSGTVDTTAASTLKLVVKAKVSYYKEYYYIDNLRAVVPAPVLPDALPWVEDFTDLPDGATSDDGPTAWTAFRSQGNFAVENNAFVVNDSGDEGVLETNLIDVADVSEIMVTLEAYTGALGDGLESSDYVELYVTLDEGSELFVGRVQDDNPTGATIIGTVDTSSASVVKLIVRAKVSYYTEYYYIDKLSVEATQSPPTAAPSTTSPTVAPTWVPTVSPSTALPTVAPTGVPTASPSTATPTVAPTVAPTIAPTLSQLPSATPLSSPSMVPSLMPSSSEPTTMSPTTQPPSKAPVAVVPFSGTWIEVDATAPIDKRHEACFVMVNSPIKGRKAYLIGGRGNKDTDIYDPIARQWTKGASPDIELHHMQCKVHMFFPLVLCGYLRLTKICFVHVFAVGVAARGKIWLVAPWTGGYPKEKNVDKMYVYDPDQDSWDTSRKALPIERRRGSSAIVVDANENFIYASHGNSGGHETGNHATSFGYLDVYDIENDEWSALPGNAPNPRDHTCGGMVNGRLCVASGRNGGLKNWPSVAKTDCYDFSTNSWTEEAEIPNPRAGASCGMSCDGRLIVAGGEDFGAGVALNKVHIFDGSSWEEIDNLNVQRHGSGLAVDCVCNQIHIASGSSSGGGSPEITSLETYFPTGEDVPCNEDTSSPSQSFAPSPAPTTSAPTSTPEPTKSPTPSPSKAPVVSPVAGITGLKLIYAPTDEVIVDLDINGATTIINTVDWPLLSFNIQAIASDDVSKVSFSPSGQTESFKPYAYCGDKSGDFGKCDDISALGTHVVSASANGYPTVTAIFAVVDETPAPSQSAAPSPAPSTAAPTSSSPPTPAIQCSVPQV